MIWRPGLRKAAGRLQIEYRTFHRSTQILAGALRDEAILARYVRVVNVETGSLSDQVERVSTLLKKIDRTRYWLVQVKAGKLDQEAKIEEINSSGTSSKSPWTQPRLDEKREAEKYREQLEADMPIEDLAIVKMIDKKEDYNRLKEKKLDKKQGGQRVTSVSGNAASKGVVLTWNSTDHDVEHKLKTLTTHFKKKGPGAKGTVDVNAKSGNGRKGGVKQEQKVEMLRKMEELLCNWEQTSEEEDAQNSIVCYARRQGEIEWRAERSHATIRIEVVKGSKPRTST